MVKMAAVAQLVRAFACEVKGRGCKSPQPPQKWIQL